MHEEIIPMQRMRCIYEIDKLFGENEEIKIVRKTDSLIEFEKGSLWSNSTSPKKAYLQGTIYLKEGESKTNLEIVYERHKLHQTLWIGTFLLILIGIIALALSISGMNDADKSYQEALAFSLLSDSYFINQGWSTTWTLTLFTLATFSSPELYWINIVIGISCLLLPIILIPLSLRYHDQAETIFSKELFNQLINKSHDEPDT